MNSLSSARKIDQVTLVERKLNQVHQLISHELRRAGHQINRSSVTHFSNVDQVFYVDSAGKKLGMVYQVEPSGDEAFRNVVFLYDEPGKNLKLCDKQSSSPYSIEVASTSTRSAPCFSLFDRSNFKVEHFESRLLPLNGVGAKSHVVTIEMTLSSVMDQNARQSLSFRVTPRSWI